CHAPARRPGECSAMPAAFRMTCPVPWAAGGPERHSAPQSAPGKGNRRGRGLPRRKLMRLAAQAELFDQHLVAVLVHLLEVVEKAAAGRNQLQQATTGMVILVVALEMFGEVGN